MVGVMVGGQGQGLGSGGRIKGQGQAGHRSVIKSDPLYNLLRSQTTGVHMGRVPAVTWGVYDRVNRYRWSGTEGTVSTKNINKQEKSEDMLAIPSPTSQRQGLPFRCCGHCCPVQILLKYYIVVNSGTTRAKKFLNVHLQSCWPHSLREQIYTLSRSVLHLHAMR